MFFKVQTSNLKTFKNWQIGLELSDVIAIKQSESYKIKLKVT